MYIPEHEIYRRTIRELHDDLALPKVHVMWRTIMPKDTTGWCQGNTICIARHMSFEETVRTLAHEFRHIWQDKTGWYIILDDGGIEYQGKRYSHKQVRNGSPDLPWEQDSNWYEQDFWSRYYENRPRVVSD